MWHNQYSTPPPWFYPFMQQTPSAPRSKSEVKELLRFMKDWDKLQEEMNKKAGNKKDDNKDGKGQMRTADWFLTLTVICALMQPLYLWFAINLLKAIK